MELASDDIHPHCLQCIKFLKCTVLSVPGESCDIISCPSECGAKFHACKSREHKLLCMNEKVPCINAEFGCPSIMLRKYRGRHLISCPASVIYCSEEWDRWPIHFHEKKKNHKYSQLDPGLHNHLDVALAMRDQRMLRKWCAAAAQGQHLTDPKFMISPSSSVWVYRNWQSSRECSYPPGLEQSVCKELCKNCKSSNNFTSNALSHCSSNNSRAGTGQDTFCIDYNGLADKENSGDSNNKIQDNTECASLNKLNAECCHSESTQTNVKHELPEYNLDDVLELSRFGTMVYHQSSGERSIHVSIVPFESLASTCSNHHVACQILDCKFRNPSSTPPWCLSLGLDLTLESRSQHPPSNFMYTFLCCQEFRRDEYGWHYKNAHSDIHSGLSGCMIERCPLAQYGCMFMRKRFNPSPKNSYVVYNDVLESFGIAFSPPPEENCSVNKSSSHNSISSTQRSEDDLNLLDLPFDVLQYILNFLDSFSLANLSLTSSLLRDVCSTVLKDRGLVHLKWERHKKDNKYAWKVKQKRWVFSSHFMPIHKWSFDDSKNMSNHLKVCPYFNRISHKKAFGYGNGPSMVHPKPEKCYSDPSSAICENNTTKL